jgi:hypothetical protein
MDIVQEFQSIQNAVTAWIYIIALTFNGYAFGIIFSLFFDLKDHYRKGQIDALNGKIKYEKRENEDGETVWEKIKSDKKA